MLTNLFYFIYPLLHYIILIITNTLKLLTILIIRIFHEICPIKCVEIIYVMYEYYIECVRNVYITNLFIMIMYIFLSTYN